MKLIPPQLATPEKASPPPPPQKTEAQSKIEALGLLNDAGEVFSIALERAVRRISKQDKVTPALALAAFLAGGTDMVSNIARNTDAQDVQEGIDGHKGRNRTTGRRAGNAGATESRAAGRGKDNRANAGGDSDGAQPVKRGRGRPKGSKNRKTLEREAAERAAKRATKRVAKPKPAAKRAAPRKAVKKAAPRRLPGTIIKRAKAKGNSRNRRPAGGRKGAAKKVARKR